MNFIFKLWKWNEILLTLHSLRYMFLLTNEMNCISIYPKSVNGKDILFALLCHFLISSFHQIIQKYQSFVDVPVIFPMIVQSLPYHLHNFRERHYIVRQVWKFRHERARGTPWIIAGGFSHLDLEKWSPSEHQFQLVWTRWRVLTWASV